MYAVTDARVAPRSALPSPHIGADLRRRAPGSTSTSEPHRSQVRPVAEGISPQVTAKLSSVWRRTPPRPDHQRLCSGAGQRHERAILAEGHPAGLRGAEQTGRAAPIMYILGILSARHARKLSASSGTSRCRISASRNRQARSRGEVPRPRPEPDLSMQAPLNRSVTSGDYPPRRSVWLVPMAHAASLSTPPAGGDPLPDVKVLLCPKGVTGCPEVLVGQDRPGGDNGFRDVPDQRRGRQVGGGERSEADRIVAAHGGVMPPPWHLSASVYLGAAPGKDVDVGTGQRSRTAG